MENINLKNSLVYNRAIKHNICMKHTSKAESPASHHSDLFPLKGR